MSRIEKEVSRLEVVTVEELTCDGQFCTPTNTSTQERNAPTPIGWAIIHIRSQPVPTEPATLGVTHLCPICVQAARRIGPPKRTP